MGDGDGHVLFGNQVFNRQVGANGKNLCTALVGKACLDLLQFLADEIVNFSRVGQNVFKLVDQHSCLDVFGDNFSLLQLSEAL